MDAELIIRDAHVLSMDPAVGDLARGDVAIADGRITAVGERLPGSPGTAEIDAVGRIAIPGFVDTHRHMFQAALRGSAPAHTLTDYFDDVLGRMVPAMTPDELYVGNALSSHAAVRSGVTTVQDISNTQDSPEITDALVRALQDAPARAVFGYGNSFRRIADRSSALPDDVRRVRAKLLDDDTARVTMSLVTEQGSDDAERHNAGLAEELAVPTARHVAGAGAITRLRELGVLRPGTTFIHGNGLSPDDLRAIAGGGASLSVSPAIEMMMGHGYPVLAEVPDDVPVSLSVDVEVTCAADMFTQLRAAYQSARSHHLGEPDASPRSVTVRDVLTMATRGGAESLGLGDRIGTLTPGKRADLVLLRADTVDVAPVIDPYSTVVLQCDRSHVDTVLVDGRTVVRDGRPLADTGTLVADARAAVARLRRVGALPAA